VNKRYGSITFDDIAQLPPPGWAHPGSVRFLPDSTGFLYLQPREGELAQDLHLYDIAQGASRVLLAARGQDQPSSLEEQLRRERQRQVYVGVTYFDVAAGLLVARRGDEVLVGPVRGELRPEPALAQAENPKIFPDGRLVAFVADGELKVLDVATHAVRTLSPSSESGVSYGLAEYAAQEELDRSEGFWISPDGRHIALCRVDERHVPFYTIAHQAEGGEVRLEQPRYPFVGHENAHVALGIIASAGGDIAWLDTAGEYLLRVEWTERGLAALWCDRSQQNAEWRLYRQPWDAGGEVLWHEETHPWFNVNDATRFLPDGRILFRSERDGIPRLYLQEADGAQGAVTPPGTLVYDLSDFDPSTGVFRCVGSAEDPTVRQIYAGSLGAGELTPLTTEEAYHQATFAPDHRTCVLQASSPMHPVRTVLLDLPSGTSRVVHEFADLTAESLGIAPPEFVDVPRPDGVVLHGALYRPAGQTGALPLVVSVYGGTHAQMVTKTWDNTADLRVQYLVQHGCLVFKLDNRGSAGRGLAFEAPIDRAFATVELEDQVIGVRHLVAQGLADPERVGIFGWSYGGYMTLTALTKAPDVFRCGVAGAPVTDFRWYDTAYTERYMGTDADNHTGYEEASVLNHVDRLRGDLLIVHGMVDENVHFRHTAQLVRRLIALRKPFEILPLPESRHMVRGFEERRIVWRRTLEFLLGHLGLV